MKYLFIDESGDHNLLPNKIDPTFPLFVLTGIIFEKKTYKKFQQDLLKLKKKVLGNEKVILHALELNRPNITKQKEIGYLTNREPRKNFYFALNQLIAKHDFSIVTFVINKPWFAKQFSSTPPDPYFLSFSFLFSIFEEQLGEKENGEMYVERRNKILDKQFLLAWESAKLTRVGLVENQRIQQHNILKPSILKKSWQQSGLELADLISYRISRNCLGKAEKPMGNEINLSVLNTKNMTLSGLPEVPNVKEAARKIES